MKAFLLLRKGNNKIKAHRLPGEGFGARAVSKSGKKE